MSPVGNEQHDKLKIKIHTFEGTLHFHNFVHIFPSLAVLEEAALPSSHSSLVLLVVTRVLYADVIEKMTVFS
jgi:hypothetical protein